MKTTHIDKIVILLIIPIVLHPHILGNILCLTGIVVTMSYICIIPMIIPYFILFEWYEDSITRKKIREFSLIVDIVMIIMLFIVGTMLLFIPMCVSLLGMCIAGDNLLIK